jgi:glycosyltransferase involved in cell wall biosynthesis
MEERDISVVICTCGRAQLLRGAIESLVSQPFDASRYEIVVVDDNAKDNTAQVTAELAQRFPQVRYVKCDGRGLLHARVTGQNESRGRYIGYLDDDAKACADWLERAWRIAKEMAPVCFGGPFYPFYISKKPKWYRNEYGSFTQGKDRRYLHNDEYLCGGNIFFASEPLRETGGFDPEFCRPGERWTYGDESIPQDRLRSRLPAARFFYDPQLYILHLVRPERLNIVRAARECFAMGRAYVKLNGVNTRDPRLLPHAWRCGRSFLRFWSQALIAAWFRDRTSFPLARNYIYERAFKDLREAGVFFQSLCAVREFRRQRQVTVKT